MQVVIVDYGSGNLRSALKAFERAAREAGISATVTLSADADHVASADRVVLSVTVHDPERSTAEGQFVEFTESGGVRLRPWSIRYATPTELDELATRAGFDLEHRWEAFGRSPFDDDSSRHVSVYRKR